jgi:transglutaminase-like putative cysteine protease
MIADAGLPRSRLAQLRLTLSRDKGDTLLLLAAASMVLAPHAGHLPWWVSATCACILLWRALITLRGTRMPPSFVLLPLAIGAMVGVFITYKTLLGREAGVAMAVLLVGFKMLEMHARRDLFVVVFVCFFLVLTNFFYSQSIFTALLMIVSIIGLLTAQLSFQFTGAMPPLGQRLKLGAKILGIAAPLALAMFFLFPRIQGPLWGLPGDANSGKTGLSNSMSPGNISNLAQSSEIAFRVKFNAAAPAQPRLYWRALVLAEFDGRTWTQGRREPKEKQALARGKQAVDYTVTQEPTGQRWLFALDVPDSVPLMDENQARLTSAFELRSAHPIDQRVRYDVTSQLDYKIEADGLAMRERYLALPDGFNPKALQAGLALQQEADPVKRVRTVLARFRTEEFIYTLEPPPLGPNSVDEFLYETRAGFCEHYASSFVVLMRAANVPARVVTGYQGGEYNPVDGFLGVRQSDAHAWAEVWLAQRGWVRIDPTAAVAPERVERNLARALPDSGVFGNLINIDLDNDSLLSQLRFRLGALNNGWNQWVLNYDPKRQHKLVDSLGDALGNWRYLAALAALIGLVFVARARRLRKEKDPVDTLYSALCLQMGRLGMTRAADEGPNAYAQRLAGAALTPDKKAAVMRFLSLYSAYKYGAQAPDRDLVPTLKRLLNTAQ